MGAVLVSTWALLLGIGLLLMGNAMLSTLIGLRATIEGFETDVIGLVASGYFLGFLAGSWLVQRWLTRVGHIRVFAALASLASIAALGFLLIIDPWAWFLGRLITGFAYAGLYVVAETWLNDRATNDTRGQLLAIYVAIQMGGSAAGQVFFGPFDPGGFILFLIVSILVSVALIPMLLTAAAQPDFSQVTPISLTSLYRASPLGALGILSVGMAMGAWFHLLPVFSDQSGLSVAQTATLIAACYVGAMILQWPIGRISDRFDRRWVIVGISVLSAVLALAIAADRLTADFMGLTGVALLHAGLLMSLYPLLIAHVNDHLTPPEMISAGSTITLAFGVGAIAGPSGAGLVMDVIGAPGLFWWCGVIHMALVVYGLYRMTQRAAVPLDEQADVVIMPQAVTPTSLILSPEVSMEDQYDLDFGGDSGPANDTTAAEPETVGGAS